MSVNKDKTLVKVRTFAKDFAQNKPGDNTPVVSSAPETPVIKKPKTAVVPKPTPKKKKKSQEFIKKVDSNKSTEEQAVASKKPAEPIPTKKSPDLNDLQKEIEKVQQTPSVETKPEKTAHSTPAYPKKKPAVRVPTGPATVITATKRSSGRGSSHSIIDSIIAWFKELQKQRKRKKTPTYTIEQTSRRKGVIQKATTKSGALFTADNETLREAILRRRDSQSHELDVNWSPNTDVGFNLLESPDAPEQKDQPHNVQVSFRKRTTSTPEIVEPTSSWEFIEPSKAVAKPAPAEPEPVVPVKEPVVDIPEPIAPKSEPEIIPTPLPKEPEPVKPISEPKTKPTKSETTTNTRSFSSFRPIIRFADLSTNALTMLVIGIIVTMLVAILLSRALYGVLVPTETPIAVEPSTPILAGVTVLDIKLENDSPEGLMTAIDQTDTFAQAPIQEFRFKHPDGTLLTPATFMSLLGFNLTPSFAQSINTAHLVLIDHTNRGLLLQVNDPITALGSMLEWEERMQVDLDAIFYTSTMSGSAQFVDDIYGQTDVRVLTDQGDTLIVYGFIDSNTILITDSSETFGEIIQTGTVY